MPLRLWSGGKTQQRSSGDRPDDDEGTGEASSDALGKDSGEAVGGNLCSEPLTTSADASLYLSGDKVTPRLRPRAGKVEIPKPSGGTSGHERRQKALLILGQGEPCFCAPGSGNPDGTGSVHSADDAAGADADLRSAIQRVELRIPTGAKRWPWGEAEWSTYPLTSRGMRLRSRSTPCEPHRSMRRKGRTGWC